MIKKLSYNDGDIYNTKSILYGAIGDLLRQTEFTSKKSESEIVDKIISYSIENISHELDLEQVSAVLGYNRNYLLHIIKSTAGINFRMLSNCIKFERSKSLLINTENSMGEIAYLSGFGTEQSFNRVFRTLSGMTPTEYRNKIL